MRRPTTARAIPKATETRASRLWTSLKAASWSGSPTMFQTRVTHTQMVQAAAASSRVERARKLRMHPCYRSGGKGGLPPVSVNHRLDTSGGRVLGTRRGTRKLVEAEGAGDVGLEDLAGPLIQAHGPHEPGPALHAHLGHVAVAAEHLDGPVAAPGD